MKSAAQVGVDLASWVSSTDAVTGNERAELSLSQNIPGYDKHKIKLGKRKLLDNGEGKIVDKMCRDRKNVTETKKGASNMTTARPEPNSLKRQ